MKTYVIGCMEIVLRPLGRSWLTCNCRDRLGTVILIWLDNGLGAPHWRWERRRGSTMQV